MTLRWTDWTQDQGHDPLKLTAEHFPLPRPLQTLVMARYADVSAPVDPGLAMNTEELLGYLRNIDHNKFEPMEGILAQTEAIGDPALPSTEHTAILHWLGEAMRDWEQHFAPEEPLAGQLRRLKPVVAALAVTEASFLTPGAHPLHQLLDSIQLQAIGWQPRLGRVGQALQDQVSAVVDAVLASLDSPTTDLAALSAEVTASAAKARTRSNKLAQRLIETEQGRIRIATSKQQAALMINEALEQYPAPAPIGEFLKGPWHDSAQLVLLKCGEDSVEWEEMSRATTMLLDSLQTPAAVDAEDSARRLYVFELIAQLRKDIRRFLFSLQHDGEALNNAASLVELFHTKLLHKEALELVSISPLVLDTEDPGDRYSHDALNQLREGQWYRLDTASSRSIRAELILRLDDQQQLLFVNQAGIKVLQKSFYDFAQLLDEGKVTMLDCGASFSRCLARSAGLETQDDLDELTGVAAERARRKQEEQQKEERERARLQRQKAEQDRAELERQLREREKIEERQREQEQAERLQQELAEAERLRRERAEQERQRWRHEQDEAKGFQARWEEASRQHCERLADEHQHPVRSQAAVTPSLSGGTDLNLPRCGWLGFRDGKEAMLARLAVYDREQDNYIFVDRYGMKMRQLDGQELMLIMARGLLDILEARSRFRDEVARAQEQAED
jgi:hypothetical protein